MAENSIVYFMGYKYFGKVVYILEQICEISSYACMLIKCIIVDLIRQLYIIVILTRAFCARRMKGKVNQT